jgi:hypothetical protein
MAADPLYCPLAIHLPPLAARKEKVLLRRRRWAVGEERVAVVVQVQAEKW